MWQEKTVKRALALALIVITTAILAYALRPYLNAFLGALILYVIFSPLYEWLLSEWRWPKSLAALSVMLVSLFALLIPFSLLISIIMQEAQDLLPQFSAWLSSSTWVSHYWAQIAPQIDLSTQLTQVGPTIKSIFFGTLSAVKDTLISSVIMYFIFYFLLVTANEKIYQAIYALVPFSKSNAVRLAHEFRNITYSTLLTSGLIALIQGSLLTLTFLIFGLPGAFLWGFAGCLMSFFPIIGVSSIWLPASVIVFLTGRPLVALGVLACGIFISTVDNFIRPLIQQKVGSIHPLVSLLGIFMGLSLFGLIGIVIGPLMLTYFLLTVGMFKEEYIK
ncbi:MAG: AI-2E family transporter [Candidatus Falkowbacteria bacterium]